MGKTHILAGPLKRYLLAEAKTKIHRFTRVADDTLERADREVVAEATKLVVMDYKPRKHASSLVPVSAAKQLLEEVAKDNSIKDFVVTDGMVDALETRVRAWADGHVARLPSCGQTI